MITDVFLLFLNIRGLVMIYKNFNELIANVQSMDNTKRAAHDEHTLEAVFKGDPMRKKNIYQSCYLQQRQIKMHITNKS